MLWNPRGKNASVTVLNATDSKYKNIFSNRNGMKVEINNKRKGGVFTDT